MSSSRRAEAPSTLAEALWKAAEQVPERGFRFEGLRPGSRFLGFAELHERARAFALGLRAQGLEPGDRVLLVIPDNESFVVAFLGCVLARAVAVPVTPPPTLRQLGSYLEHVRSIACAGRVRLIVTADALVPVLGRLLESLPGARLTTHRKVRARSDAGSLEPPDAQELCFLQFTSGSTSRPKGVLVNHANLRANARCIVAEGLDLDGARDVGISWLPLYHDMGLIGFVIAPIFFQIPVVFLPPLDFIRRPRIWLEAISRHGGTATFAPNFAYGLVPRRCPVESLKGIDLSSLRVAGCGAEPIHRDTLNRFSDHLGPLGLRREALMPCYGLAEATLAVSFAPHGDGLRSQEVDREALSRGVVQPTVGAASSSLVSCGRPFREHEVAAFDEAEQRLPEGRVGELWVRGPSVTAGYFEAPAATDAAFRSGWVRTGDLGFLSAGEVFVCGRLKEMIILRGCNYYPQDLEAVANEVPGVRRGNTVAFGVEVGEEETLVLVAESRHSERRAELAEQIRQSLSRELGLAAHEVVVVGAGVIPKTSSGKLRRLETRIRYLAGSLEEPEEPGTLRRGGRLAQHAALSVWRHVRTEVGARLGGRDRAGSRSREADARSGR